MPEIDEDLIAKAKLLAEATGRKFKDVLADLEDDGILNDSNTTKDDLITQLKEAAELIDAVQSINKEVSENTVLNGGNNKTDVSVETTLEGDVVDRAIASVNRKVVELKKIAIIIIPVILLITGGTMSNMDMFSSSDSKEDEYYPPPTMIEQYGCMDYGADNYDSQATFDDGSCYYTTYGCMNDAAPNYNAYATVDDGSCEPEKEEQCVGDLSAISSWVEIYEGNNIEAHMSIANNNQCDTEIELMISFYYENGWQFSLDSDLPTYWVYADSPETTLIIRHDSFTNLGDGNYSLETRFIPIGQGEVCCEITDSVLIDTTPEPEPIKGCTDSTATNYDAAAEEDDGSCTYPPQCNGTASFYNSSYSISHNNTNNSSLANLTVFWDADWSCQEQQYVEIDIFVKFNDTIIRYLTISYTLNGQSSTVANYTISDLETAKTYEVCLIVYVERNGSWTQDAENNQIVSIS